jgi:hypothetical protein
VPLTVSAQIVNVALACVAANNKSKQVIHPLREGTFEINNVKLFFMSQQ